MASPLNNTTTRDQEMADLERNDCVERVQWVLNTPKPPGLSQELIGTAVSWRNKVPFLNMQSGLKHELFSMLKATFPILSWCQNYKPNQFKRDLLAGLTLASLCIPQVFTFKFNSPSNSGFSPPPPFCYSYNCIFVQSIGYATLAKVDPQYGLCKLLVENFCYSFGVWNWLDLIFY